MRSKDVKPKVAMMLQLQSHLRNSDKRLLLSYWKTEGLRLTPEQERIFMQCTPSESITRARRSLRGKYPGDEQTEEARYNRFIEERDEHGQPIMIFKGAR